MVFNNALNRADTGGSAAGSPNSPRDYPPAEWTDRLGLRAGNAESSGWRGATSRADFVMVDQSVRATHSAKGATARPQVGAVSDNRAVNNPIRRQLPSRCSKNHSRPSGSRVIQSSTKASTWGRTASIKSHAKESRAGISTCRKPRPGSSPSGAAARRDSDSSRHRDSSRLRWADWQPGEAIQIAATCGCRRCASAQEHGQIFFRKSDW